MGRARAACPRSGASMPSVFNDIDDFMPYAKSMANKLIREGNKDGLQLFVNELVDLENSINEFVHQIPGAWAKYRDITKEREQRNQEIEEQRRKIEELNRTLAESFGGDSADVSDIDVSSMLSDDDDGAFDFGDDDAAPGTGSATSSASGASGDDAASDAPVAQDDDDDDEDMFSVFGGDYGDDGSAGSAAESDSWGAEERRGADNGTDMLGDVYDNDGNASADGQPDDDGMPDIDWSGADADSDAARQDTQPGPSKAQAQPTQQPQPQPATSSDDADPFDDDGIDVLLDDDTLLGL